MQVVGRLAHGCTRRKWTRAAPFRRWNVVSAADAYGHDHTHDKLSLPDGSRPWAAQAHAAAAGIAGSSPDVVRSRYPARSPHRLVARCRRKCDCHRQFRRDIGYLYNPSGDQFDLADSGSTHAWVEVFVPGAGWISFDPTNRSVGSANLIPVAVGRLIQQVVPVAGRFHGRNTDLLSMDVSVDVEGELDVALQMP